MNSKSILARAAHLLRCGEKAGDEVGAEKVRRTGLRRF
jgi:hypothetical protein